MFCQNCGSLLPENAKVCPECGTPVSTEAAGGAAPEPYVAPQPQPVPQPQPQPAYQPQPQPAPQPAYQPHPAYTVQPEQPQPRSKGLAITALILSIVSIVCCCIPFLQIPLALAGLILGICGIRSGLKVMAIVAVIISALSLVFGIIMLLVLLLSPESVTYSYNFNDGDIQRWFENFFR